MYCAKFETILCIPLVSIYFNIYQYISRWPKSSLRTADYKRRPEMRVLFAGYPGSETRIPTSFLLPFTSLFLVICFELPRTRPFSEFPSRLELSGVNCIPHWLNSRFFVCCKCVNQNSVPGALPNKFVKPFGYFFSFAFPAGFVFGGWEQCEPLCTKLHREPFLSGVLMFNGTRREDGGFQKTIHGPLFYMRLVERQNREHEGYI